MDIRSSNETVNFNDMDMLMKKEDEHCRLQRQFRTIQTDRLHRSMGVHPQFRKQDHLMRTLKKEYISILKDLKIAKAGAHKKRERLEKDLKSAILLRMKTGAECEDGLIVMNQIDGVLRRYNKDMMVLRKLTTANMGEMEKRREQSEQRLISTENKLEAAMLRFNAVQFENKKIREEIEGMLQERAVFNKAWSKMMTALNTGKKFLNDLFESSTLAYDQRDELCAKLKTVQEKGKIDQVQQVQEMRDLQKAFDHEMKIYYFLARKGVIRINKKEKIREEEKLRKEQEDREIEYQKHLKIIDDIHDYTGEMSIEKIIEAFELMEHRNFSVYKLLTDYCAENVMLDKVLKRIRQDIEDRRDWNEMQEVSRQRKIDTMSQELCSKKQKTEELRQKLAERQQLIDKAMEQISDMFRMLDCSLEPFQNLLGDKQPSVNQLNLSLRLITDKIKEHIETVYYYERFIQKKQSTSRLKKFTVHPQLPTVWSAVPIQDLVTAEPCPACIETRWLSRVSDILETPFDNKMALEALATLIAEPAYLRSDRIHPLAECRVPRSRAILAKRYLNN